MKTQWDFLGGYILIALIPLVAGAIPTFNILEYTLGGGPIRQLAIIGVAILLPSTASHQLVEAFMNASTWGEYGLYLPIALNVALILLWLFSAYVALRVNIQNWFEANKYQSTRKAAK